LRGCRTTTIASSLFERTPKRAGALSAASKALLEFAPPVGASLHASIEVPLLCSGLRRGCCGTDSNHSGSTDRETQMDGRSHEEDLHGTVRLIDTHNPVHRSKSSVGSQSGNILSRPSQPYSCHRQNDLADVVAGLHAPVSLRGLPHGVGGVDNHIEPSVGDERPDLRFDGGRKPRLHLARARP
jgi:hypothetical protein